MAGRDEEFDAELADRGDDRPGIDEADENDYSALDLVDPEVDDASESDDDNDEDDDDYPEDATEDDIDLVAALYREDGQPAATALDLELANDLDGLIDALRRVPGDAGAVGVVSIDSDFFVSAALDWPIARDAADFLGVDLPDDDDDSEPVGDFDLFADAGLSEMELEAITTDDDADPLESLEAIVDKLGFAGVYDKVASGFGLEG
jgi:putative tRNA adenosine deaminase-associated protein